MSDEIRSLFIDARPLLSIDESMVPEAFALHQNYPNPFNPTTTINYDMPESQIVSIMIYDVMGREVRTLINEFQEVGYRTIRWDATDNLGRSVSAGMYIYTIQAGDFRQVRKMVLLKQFFNLGSHKSWEPKFLIYQDVIYYAVYSNFFDSNYCFF